MNTISQLIKAVANARSEYLSMVGTIDESNAPFKPAPDAWSVVDITEHLYWAEHGGIAGMWKTLHAIREGKMDRTFESAHKELRIEAIVERTWKAKEQVPAVAAPRMGGTLAFWRASLGSLQQVLDAFGTNLKEEELRLQAHPHPISGAMDFQQRLEFLRFHIQRHHQQAKDVIAQLVI